MSKLRAYISYAPANLTFVERIAADLTARSIEAGVDRGLLSTRGGSEGGWDSVRQVIDGSDVVLLIASPQAVANPDVQRELQHAVQARKLIIPLKLRQVSLPAPVDSIQWFDFEEGRYDRDLKYLLLSLAFVLPGGAPTLDPSTKMARLPEPPERLQDLFIAATSAKARNTPQDRERAAAIYASILERDPNFQNGLVQGQLGELNDQLQAQRIQNLERYAADARAAGDWPREIAALNAWGRLQGERTVEPLLAVARQNQQHASLYAQAASIADSDPGAAAEMLRMLYQGAPSFGDPRGLAAKLGVAGGQRAAEVTEKRAPASPPKAAHAPEQPRPAPPPTNPTQYTPMPPAAPVPQTPGVPWKWYGAFALGGIIVGWVFGQMALEALFLDMSCYGFGGAFWCEDPTATYIAGGLLLGLAAAYFIRRAMQKR